MIIKTDWPSTDIILFGNFTPKQVTCKSFLCSCKMKNAISRKKNRIQFCMQVNNEHQEFQ